MAPWCNFRGLVLYGNVIAEHAAQVVTHLHLEHRRYRRRFGRDIVLVVEHRAKIAEQTGHRDIPVHMALIAIAEERNRAHQGVAHVAEVPLEFFYGLLVFGRILYLRSDPDWILRKIFPSIAAMIVERVFQQLEQQALVFSLWSKKPGAQRVSALRGEVERFERLKPLGIFFELPPKVFGFFMSNRQIWIHALLPP